MTTVSRFDSPTMAFIDADLRKKRAEIYKRRYPQLKMASGQILPIKIDSSLEWMDEVEIEEYDTLGVNSLIADYSKGGNRVGVVYRRVRYPIRTHGNHTGWNWEEINKAQAKNQPLQAHRLTATRDAYERYVNQIGYDGDVQSGLPGIFTSQCLRLTSSATLDSGSTATNILAAMNSWVAGLLSATNGIAVPKKIVIPVSEHNYIFSTYRSDQSDMTIGEAFLAAQKAQGLVEEILADDALKGKGDSGSNVALVLPNDEQVAQLCLAMPYRILPQQEQNLEVVVHTVGRISGAHIYKPLELLVVNGI